VIKKYIVYTLLFFVFSCNNIDFVLNENNQTNPLKNKTLLLVDKNTDDSFTRALYSFFGNSKEYDYILKTEFLEKKENRIVKENQVAEKIEYTLEVDYDLFYKNSDCKIFNKKVISKFSFTPKSGGYNFGSDRSFDKFYSNSVDQNISSFVNSLIISKNCLE
tara:strand:- start:207 stop:692 length:486 start_codon:yes stop_codon:yes gene_type:complete